MKIRQRALSILLAAVMVLTFMPVMAYADSTYKPMGYDGSLYEFDFMNDYKVTLDKDAEETFYLVDDDYWIESAESSDTSVLEIADTEESWCDVVPKKAGTAKVTITGYPNDEELDDEEFFDAKKKITILVTVENTNWIDDYNGENVFKGCSNLNSCFEFDVNDPVYATWYIEVNAKKKTTDKLTFILQRKEKSGYKTYYSFKMPINKSKYTWNYWFNNKASDKLKEGHYRLKIVPKNKSKSFYSAKCYLNTYESIKAVSPSKLKKVYELWPGQNKTIAKSSGSSQLYIKGVTGNFKYSWIDYNQFNNEWYVAANNGTSSSVKEQLTVRFANGKKKTTTVSIKPLRWWRYWLYEGESFNEYYYRWNAGKWGKWKLKNIKWSSTNSKVASVSKSGRVKAKKLGTCYIVGKYKNKTAKCKVTVYASKPRKGMTKKQVLNSRWGSPDRRNDYGNGQLQWVYEWNDGGVSYVYFKNGKVTKIQRFNY